MARPRITYGQPRRRRDAQPFANILCIASLISLFFVFGLVFLVVRLDNGEEAATESINYLLRLQLPEGGGEGERDEEDFSFPVYLTKTSMKVLRSSEPERWQPILVDTIYQARPHILAARPWACMCCGARPARTTLGSPAYIVPTDGGAGASGAVGFVYDLAPFVLCGALPCEMEAKRRTKDILALAGPKMQQLSERGRLHDFT